MYNTKLIGNKHMHIYIIITLVIIKIDIMVFCNLKKSK